MATHENNKKKFKRKRKKLHRRGADCMFRSLTAGQNNSACMHSPVTLGTGLF